VGCRLRWRGLLRGTRAHAAPRYLVSEGVAQGYTQRANLGFKLTVTPYGDHTTSVPSAGGGAILSQSLLEHVGGDPAPAIPATDLADPTYGVVQPVIRLYVPKSQEGVALDPGLFLVSLDIAERKDDDYDHTGSP
jgi:hypothetical protein